MARAALNWTQKAVAARAKLAAGTVKHLEAANGPVPGRIETLVRIQAVFEKEGIRFPEDPQDPLGLVRVEWLPPSLRVRRK